MEWSFFEGLVECEAAETEWDLCALLGFVPDVSQASFLKQNVKRGILNCSRQWGKSTVCALKALETALRVSEASVIVISPSRRQSGEFLRKVKGFVRKLGLATPTDGVNELSVVLPNGSRIVGLPGVEGTIRGFSAIDLLIVDEAARVSDEQYYAAGPMLAVKDGALWLLSTPFGARGFFWKEWAHGGEEWTRLEVSAPECARISEGFLDSEQRRLGREWFRQEYLCEFVEAEGGVFREELLREAMVSGLGKLFQ